MAVTRRSASQPEGTAGMEVPRWEAYLTILSEGEVHPEDLVHLSGVSWQAFSEHL